MTEADNSDIKNRSFTILGAGRSGIALAKFLTGKGYKVFLSDKNPEEKLQYFNHVELSQAGIEYETGGHSGRIYEQDIIVKSPGIKPDEPEIVNAKEKGKKVLSEIEIGFRFTPCPIIAITGTNGKTTTTVATGAILKEAGLDVKVCGNVGEAFSNILNELSNDSIVVLEVSSYQLNDIEKFKPKVAVFLNFTKDHLEWHGSIENYFKAKMRVAENQDQNDLFIFNADDEYILTNMADMNSGLAAFGLERFDLKGLKSKVFTDAGTIMFQENDSDPEPVMRISEMKLMGTHNVQNFLAATLVAKSVGVSNVVIKNALSRFKGVEHRIEFVGQLNGVSFYNDSKATNVDSMTVAVKSFDKVVLILGGLKETVSFESIFEILKQRVSLMITVGENKQELYEIFKDILPVKVAEDLENAVDISLQSSVDRTPVLFSPSFKSFDSYNNFEDRGNHFKSIVRSRIKNSEN